MAFFLRKSKNVIFVLLHFSSTDVPEKWRYIPVSRWQVAEKEFFGNVPEVFLEENFLAEFDFALLSV